MLNNCPGTNICCKKDVVDGEGVCNANIISQSPFDTFSELDKEVTEKPCASGTLTQELQSTDLITYTWRCGITPCSATTKEITGANYAYDGNCDEENRDFITISYDNPSTGEKINRRIYCPAPLPFFTLTNIVAVLVVVGIFYVIMQRGRKGKSSKRKR